MFDMDLSGLGHGPLVGYFENSYKNLCAIMESIYWRAKLPAALLDVSHSGVYSRVRYGNIAIPLYFRIGVILWRGGGGSGLLVVSVAR
jgi:hypothetical protein